MPSNCASATATPSRTITAYTSRRTKRSRVDVAADSSPRTTAAAICSPRFDSIRSTT
jgi:hypothetical protein